MPIILEIENKLQEVFEKRQAQVLTEVIFSSYNELVKTSDFNELKWIVKDLANAQKRTEIRVEELANAQKRTEIKVAELANAQKRTEIKVEELANSQNRTEIKVEELAEAQKETQKEVTKLDKTMQEIAEIQKRTEIEIQKLGIGLNETRGEVGGLGRSMGYAFENEAYRMLPKALDKIYGIKMKEKLIRTEIGGKEINILGKAQRDGKEILIIGESKLRLDERGKNAEKIFMELEEKVLSVQKEYKEEIVIVLITHYASKGFIDKAKQKGIIVVQSFEW